MKRKWRSFSFPGLQAHIFASMLRLGLLLALAFKANLSVVWLFHGLLSLLLLATIARLARGQCHRSALFAYLNVGFYYLYGVLAIVFL